MKISVEQLLEVMKLSIADSKPNERALREKAVKRLSELLDDSEPIKYIVKKDVVISEDVQPTKVKKPKKNKKQGESNE